MTRGDHQRGERASFRISPEVLARLRALVRDHAGKPLYLEIGTFVEQAIVKEMDRIDAQQGSSGTDHADSPSNHRRTGTWPSTPIRRQS